MTAAEQQQQMDIKEACQQKVLWGEKKKHSHEKQCKYYKDRTSHLFVYQWTWVVHRVQGQSGSDVYPQMLHVTLNDSAKKKARPLLSSRAHCPNTYPLPFSIMMTLPLSHLAPDQPVKQWQRKSPFLSSQRTVPLALQGDGEHWSGISVWKRQNKERQTQRKRVITALKIESAQSGDIQCV